jgi:serine/threonine-protein kinase HipA
MSTKTDIYVYAHWQEMPKPKIIGILSAQQAKGKKHLIKTFKLF